MMSLGHNELINQGIIGTYNTTKLTIKVSADILYSNLYNNM